MGWSNSMMSRSRRFSSSSAMIDVLPQIPLEEQVKGEKLVWGAVVLLLGTIVAYCTAFRADFIWDDNYFLWQNPLNTDPYGILKMWFTRASFDYWPLTMTVFWGEWQIWGRDPFGYHVQNVLLHAINCLLLWMVFRRLQIPGAWLASLIYALHPVNVTTVTWVTELKNTLSMCLVLLSVLAYLRYERALNWKPYVLSLGLFLFSLCAKSSLVGIPILILVRAWWQDNRIDKKALLRAAPFFAISLLMGLVTIWFQLYNPSRKDICMETPANFAVRVAGAGSAIWFYWYKTFVPVNLMMIYPHWKISALDPLAYVPTLALGGLAGLFWAFRQTWGKPLLAGMVCFLALIFPALGFVNMSYMMHSLVADHFQYLPISISIVVAVSMLWKALSRQGMVERYSAIGGTFALVIMLGVLTGQRTWTMRGHIPLWRDTIERNPAAWMAYYHLGTELCLQSEQLQAHGKGAEAQATLKEALDWLNKGAQIQPDYPAMWANIGVAQSRLGQQAESIESYRKALTLEPENAQSLYNYAMALKGAGRFDEARANLEKLVKITAANKDGAAELELGVVLLQQGGKERLDQAREQFAHVLKKDPKALMAMLLMGNLEVQAGRNQDAAQWYSKAAEAYPQSPVARRGCAMGMIQLNRFDEAAVQFASLLNMGPMDADAYNAYGFALMQSHRIPQAMIQFQSALQLNPLHIGVITNVGMAYEMAGQAQQAVAMYQRALALQPNFAPAQDGLKRLIERSSGGK